MAQRDETIPPPDSDPNGDEPTVERSRRPAPPSIRQIDRYRILHVIGTGGMATVYAALQPTPRRTVALKVLRPEIIDDTAIRRFRREAEILGRLRHPSIAQVYDAGTFEQDGRTCPYFVMEFIPGAKTILEYVAKKQLNRRDRLKLFVNVCRAVHYGHQHRVLHRDLKPGNILIDQSGRLKIIDFGVASAPGLRVSGTTMNTEAGRLVGTIQYMSPEQVSADPQNIDVRSDVYGLGVLLYKLMTGQFPYNVQGQPIYEAIRMIREDDPIRPSRHDSDLRGDLETITLRAIAKEPSQRYRSVSEMADDIVRYLNRQPIRAKSASPAHRTGLWVRRQRSRIIGGIAVLVLLAGAVGATTWWLTRDDASGAHKQSSTPQQNSSGWLSAAGQGASGPQPIVLNRQKGIIRALAFDGSSLLATGATDHTIIVWDTHSSEPVRTIAQHENALQCIAFAEAGHRGVSLDTSGVMYEFNTSTQDLPSTVLAPVAAINDVALDDSGEHLAMACEDSTVRVHDFVTEQWTTIRGTTGPFECVAYSPDGRRLVAGSQRGDVYIFNALTGEREFRLDGLRSAVARVTFDPSGMFAVAADSDGRAMVWNLQPAQSTGPTIGNPQAGREFDAAAGPLRASAVSPSRHWFVAATSSEIRLWDLRPLQAGNAIEQRGPTIELETIVHSVAIDANAQRLAIGLLEGTANVYPVADLIEWAQSRKDAAATPSAIVE